MARMQMGLLCAGAANEGSSSRQIRDSRVGGLCVLWQIGSADMMTIRRSSTGKLSFAPLNETRDGRHKGNAPAWCMRVELICASLPISRVPPVVPNGESGLGYRGCRSGSCVSGRAADDEPIDATRDTRGERDPPRPCVC
jgi:hypothetical protein